MDFLRKKFNFLGRSIVFITTLTLVSIFAIPALSSAEVLNEDALETEYLDVNSPIILEFDAPLQWNGTAPTGSSTDHQGITLTVDGVDEPNNKVSFSVEINANNPHKLIITPDRGGLWKNDQDYTLSIPSQILLDSVSGTPMMTTNETYTFGTNSLTFEETLVSKGANKAAIEELLEIFTPRNIVVNAPLRYIQEVEIIHKVKDSANKTESVTNVDTVIDTSIIQNGQLKRIEVNILGQRNTVLGSKVFENLSVSKKLYDVGFTGLPDTTEYDVEVILYGEDDDIILDKRLIKVPVNKAKPVTHKGRYSTAGKNYTLYDLMEKPKNLQTLLDQNSMNELKVQVVHQ